ncbi:MAG: hypothetical protein R3E79_49895 [Caldilineaceae bacterium]
MGTLISWVGLCIALVAVAYAWKLQQELHIASRRLDRYNRALFDANDEIRKLREDFDATLAQVRAEMRLSQGISARFNAKMTVQEAMALHPQVGQLLASFHLGGCNSCAVDPTDTLADICRENGRDLAQVLQSLNYLMTTAQAQPTGQPQLIKVPNVELSF